MKIFFAKKHLEKMAKDIRLAQKELGQLQGNLYIRRLNELYAAKTLEDVRNLPGHYHELKGNRNGQWACNLLNPYRLIFKPIADPIPIDKDGKFIWREIKEIEIVEITNYHGK